MNKSIERLLLLFPCIGNSYVNKYKDLWYRIELDDTLNIKDNTGKCVLEVNNLPFPLTEESWLGDVLIYRGINNKGKLYIIAVNNQLILEIWHSHMPNMELKIDTHGYKYKLFHDNNKIQYVFSSDEKSIKRFEAKDILKVTNGWKEAFVCNDEDPNMKRMLQDTWMLHRVSMYNPEGRMENIWESPCRVASYQRGIVAMWDTIHIIEDVLPFSTDIALGYLKNHFKLYRNSDGMVALDYAVNDTQPPKGRENGCVFESSQPPVWAPTMWKVYKQTKDGQLLHDLYRKCVENVKWWENNRMIHGGLFTWNPQAREVESGYDRSFRFGGKIERGMALGIEEKAYSQEYIRDTSQNIANIDISSQMAMYYKYMGMFSEELNLKETKMYEEKFNFLKEAINNTLWNDEDGFYYDKNFDIGKWIKIKTIAGFWPLICGVADKRKAQYLVKHLTDPGEFWSLNPVATVSQDEDEFILDCWNGPVWVSHNYWIIKGLISYGYSEIAKELAENTCRFVKDVYEKTHNFFEYYHPFKEDIRGLRREFSEIPPNSYYIGHLPIHAIYERTK